MGRSAGDGVSTAQTLSKNLSKNDPSSDAKPSKRPAKTRLGSQKPANKNVEASNCKVSIGAKPVWAELWVDGKKTGKNTPVINFGVPCGKRSILLKNPEKGLSAKASVSLKPGKKYKKIFTLK